MGGAVPPLPQCAFMAWCSVKGRTGTTSLLPLLLQLYRTDDGLLKTPEAKNFTQTKNNIFTKKEGEEGTAERKTETCGR
jgi:hypothetical protein